MLNGRGLGGPPDSVGLMRVRGVGVPQEGSGAVAWLQVRLPVNRFGETNSNGLLNSGKTRYGSSPFA